ncbi:MAG TPA: glycosyltransferase family 39 protein [Candidatus Limnocylindrales bacterium]
MQGNNENPIRAVRPTSDRSLLRPGVPALCGLGALLVFLIGITGPSLWIDEGHTWNYATEPLGTMLGGVVGSTNAVEAAYYVVIHFWIGLAGTSEVALRLPSAVAMALAVWLASKTAADAAGNRAAFVAGFVMIALPGVTRYAQEARPYAFAVAAVALSTFLLYRGLTRSGRRWWVGYAAALAIVGYFHLLSLLVVPGQLAPMLLIDRSRWPSFAAAGAAAAAAVLPVAILGFVQRGQIAWIPPVQFDYLWNGFAVITGSLAVTAAIAATALVGSQDRRLMALGLGTALATPVLLWTLGWLAPLYLGRYLLGAAPGIAILSAGSLTTVRTARLVALGVILVVLVWPQQVAYRTAAAHNQDYRGAADLVATDCSARISYDGMSRDAMVYYLQQKPCAPSESAPADHLWVVQAAGPQATEPG